MSTSKLIGRDEILSFRGRRFDTYQIPDLGPVRIRNLTEYERSMYEAENLNEDGETDLEKVVEAKRRLIAACVVDEDGNPVFSPNDIQALADVDGGITGKLFDVCRKHCGFEKGDIERLAGNAPDGSNSDSP